jgi:nucleotide-binding universal stress UspA family protein
MFEKILVCLDGSKLAEQILPFATEEALRFRSKVVLLHVVPETSIVSPNIPGAPGVPVETKGMVEQAQEEQNEASAYLDKVTEALQEKGLDTESVVLLGSPGDVIINYANENNTGLIAMATHGRSGLGRAVFGSVADHVVRESEIPILIIRPQVTRD